MNPARRSVAVTAILLAVAALCLWASSRMTWVTVTSADGLGDAQTTNLNGGVWAAATTPIALLLIAAVAALFALRGRLVLLVAAVVILAAFAAGVPAAAAVFSGVDPGRAGSLAELPARADVVSADGSSAAPLLALLGSVAALAAGVMSTRRPATRSGLSAKYDGPAARRERARRDIGGRDREEEVARDAGPADPADPSDAADSGDEAPSERALWDALDAGMDPTADPSRPGPADPDRK